MASCASTRSRRCFTRPLASVSSFASIGQTLQRQIDLLSYIDVFWSLAIIGALMVPLALIMRPIYLGVAPKGH